MHHILTAEQFDTAQLAELFKKADQFRVTDEKIADRKKVMKLHDGRIVVSMFYEPSTRTRFSFEIAAKKLGIQVVGTENAAEFSSAAKGETIEDTIKVIDEYGVDAVVLRTKEDGHAARAAAASQRLAVLNGGDGKAEHPTQSVLDLYTIQNELGRLDDLKVVIGGDLAHGRTARSLAVLLSKYKGNKISFVSHPELRIGEDIKAKLTKNGTEYAETSEMHEALVGADVVYWTRTQLERLSDGEKQNGQGEMILNAAALAVIPKGAIILHPLPRQAEIPATTDADPRAKYFRQAGNGLYVRMAMLDAIMKKLP